MLREANANVSGRACSKPISKVQRSHDEVAGEECCIDTTTHINKQKCYQRPPHNTKSFPSPRRLLRNIHQSGRFILGHEPNKVHMSLT